MNTGKKRGRPSKKQVAEYNVSVPAVIDFDIVKLDNLDIDPRMMDTMKSGMMIDDLISHEGGVPCATNMVVAGTVTATEYNLSALNTAPATSSSTGTVGQIRIDANHIYVCTATNTWKRVAIATF